MKKIIRTRLIAAIAALSLLFTGISGQAIVYGAEQEEALATLGISGAAMTEEAVEEYAALATEGEGREAGIEDIGEVIDFGGLIDFGSLDTEAPAEESRKEEKQEDTASGEAGQEDAGEAESVSKDATVEDGEAPTEVTVSEDAAPAEVTDETIASLAVITDDAAGRKHMESGKYPSRYMAARSRVKSQGSSTMCGAYSLATALETAAINQLGYPSSFEVDACAIAGSLGLKAMNVMQASNLLMAKRHPLLKDGSLGVEVTDIQYIKFTDPDAIKKAIMENGSVIVIMDAECGRKTGYKYFYSPYIGSLNHAVTIVGWDDDVKMEKFPNECPGDGAWYFQNSWGDDFGSEGYGWLSYWDANLSEDGQNTVYNPGVTYKVRTPENKVAYWDGNYESKVYSCSNSTGFTYWITADRDIEITEVAFGSPKVGSYTIKLYDGYAHATDPLVVDATIEKQGYTSIQLPEPLKVKKGKLLWYKLKGQFGTTMIYGASGGHSHFYLFGQETVINDEVEEQKPAEQPKAEAEQKPTEQPKEEQKPVEQPKEEQKPAEQPKEEQKPVEQPQEEQKPVEQPKAEEKPAEQPKTEQKPTERPKEEQKSAEQPQEEKKTVIEEPTILIGEEIGVMSLLNPNDLNKVKFYSADKSIAKSSTSGVVKGKNEGRTRVFALRNGEQLGEMYVNVEQPSWTAGKYTASTTSVDMSKCLVTGKHKPVGWLVSNTTNATIDQNGILTFKKGGTVTVYAVFDAEPAQLTFGVKIYASPTLFRKAP